MLNCLSKHFTRLAVGALMVLAVFVGTGAAADPDTYAGTLKDLKARLDALEKQNRELKRSVEQVGIRPVAGEAGEPDDKSVKKMVDDYLKTKDDKKKADEDAAKKKIEDEGYKVGENTKLNASWDAGGFRYKSEDEAFNVHFGGRLMTDEVWFSQSPNLRKSATQPAGSPLGLITGVGPGIGDLQDGFFVRRVRVVADGAVYQVMEFKVEFDFENYNNLSFDESYIGARDLPFIDTIRVGQTHVPFGLEAYTSSRYLPQLERSPLFDSFYQEFAPGVFTDTTFFDQHMTTQHMFHRIDNFSQFNGASFGDGKYAYSGRVSILPIYESDGRCLLHFGASYQWRKGSVPSDFNSGTTITPPVATGNQDLVRFRTRQSIRDAVASQSDNTRVVDTGNIIADDVQSVNGEVLWYWNSFWAQSETCLAHVDNAFFPASAAATHRGDLNYWGTYAQVGYFLTGETRGYDRRFGKYDRVKPFENFFLVRDENGCCQYGLGAWELTYRYGYVDLNSDQVQGGRYGEHTVGLNWYWSSMIKFQFNYINGQRDVPSPAFSGNVQGFGLRGALEF